MFGYNEYAELMKVSFRIYEESGHGNWGMITDTPRTTFGYPTIAHELPMHVFMERIADSQVKFTYYSGGRRLGQLMCDPSYHSVQWFDDLFLRNERKTMSMLIRGLS